MILKYLPLIIILLRNFLFKTYHFYLHPNNSTLNTFQTYSNSFHQIHSPIQTNGYYLLPHFPLLKTKPPFIFPNQPSINISYFKT